MDGDYLYHLGLTKDDAPQFSDVKFFCTGGSALRIGEFAQVVADELSAAGLADVPFGLRPTPIAKTDRFSTYKVGPVLMSNHGMGMPSVSILLHEITKLLHYAGADDPVYMRLGSSGGVGVEPGTVVATTQGLNGLLEPEFTLPMLGKTVTRPTDLDAGLNAEIVAASEGAADFAVLPGKTMGTDCFYEGQARLDGAVCEHEEQEKMNFLRRAHEAGVRNIEMEATQFAAFTGRVGVRAAILCVALLNRLDGDQVLTPVETLMEWDTRPGEVALNYIKAELRK